MRSDRLSAVLASALLLLAVGCEDGAGQPPANPPGPPPGSRVFWPASSARGAVRAMALGDDGTLYLGGNFTRIGPMTGGGVPLLADTGQPVAEFPKVNGTVTAVVPDGTGGWYIGGQFSRVGGQPAGNLAHVLADGSLDSTWSPQVTGAAYPAAYVTALAFDGSVLYVGGVFGALSGAPRDGLGAIDLAGATTGWAPVLSTSNGHVSTVAAIALRGREVLLGGYFHFVNGEPRRHLAAIGADGTVAAWNPGAGPGVERIAVVGDLVYLAGYFESVAGQLRAGLAAVDAAGIATAWNPSPNGHVLALAADAGTLYVGGDFSSVGGQSRSGLAAFDAAGVLTDWSPSLDVPWVFDLAAAGGVVYAGGNFKRAGGLFRNRLAAFDASGAPTAWNPDPDENGLVVTLATGGGRVYVGGSFQWMGSATKRLGLAAVDPTGQVTDWNPGLAWVPDPLEYLHGLSGTVHALAVVGGTVYVGGDFSNVGGQRRRNLAAIDASGRVTVWNPDASGPVFALAPSGDTLYLGGQFGSVGGMGRFNLAAVKVSGEVTAWAPQADAFVTTLGVAGDTVYAGGYFTMVRGEARSNLAAIRADGTLLPWSPGPFSGADGHVSYVPTSPPPTGIWSLAVDGGTVYVSGDFGSVGGVARHHLAAIDASTGRPTAFDTALEQPAGALAIGEGRLFLGSSFPAVSDGSGHQVAPALASVPLGWPGGQPQMARLVSEFGLMGASYLRYTLQTPSVHAILVRDGVVHAGGRFWGPLDGPDRRWNVARLDPWGALLPWNPSSFP